jgi:hypothetical protein
MDRDDLAKDKKVVVLIKGSAVQDAECVPLLIDLLEVQEIITGVYVNSFGTAMGILYASKDFKRCVRELITVGVWSSNGSVLSFFAKSSFDDFKNNIDAETLALLTQKSPVAYDFYLTILKNRHRNSINPQLTIPSSVDTTQLIKAGDKLQ